MRSTARIGITLLRAGVRPLRAGSSLADGLGGSGKVSDMAEPSLGGVQPQAGLSWSTFSEALRVCAHRPHLRNSLRIALIVGTILFSINQLDVVLTGRATLGVWLKGGLTYLVPFCVSNWGILVATRRSQKPMKEAS